MTTVTVMGVPAGWYPCGVTLTVERVNAETDGDIQKASRKNASKNPGLCNGVMDKSGLVIGH